MKYELDWNDTELFLSTVSLKQLQSTLKLTGVMFDDRMNKFLDN